MMMVKMCSKLGSSTVAAIVSYLRIQCELIISLVHLLHIGTTSSEWDKVFTKVPKVRATNAGWEHEGVASVLTLIKNVWMVQEIFTCIAVSIRLSNLVQSRP